VLEIPLNWEKRRSKVLSWRNQHSTDENEKNTTMKETTGSKRVGTQQGKSDQ